MLREWAAEGAPDSPAPAVDAATSGPGPAT